MLMGYNIVYLDIPAQSRPADMVCMVSAGMALDMEPEHMALDMGPEDMVLDMEPEDMVSDNLLVDKIEQQSCHLMHMQNAHTQDRGSVQ